jgi:hypothetical protein
MEGKLTPGVFYGSAIAALCGLLLGLMLQQPWQKHPGGPQILFASAAAAELARPANTEDEAAAPAEDDQQAVGAAQLASLDATYNDPGYIPPDPLPVTRLDPDRFDVTPAGAEPVEVQAADDLDSDVDEATPVDETRTADASRAWAAPDFY